ncbi:segregation/condensation protein A [Sorangium cellulosum]|uniref:segregation/condensation protein A n=1 Tax=Sorangium cellulosum TaxID=56 RepID=UPI001F22C1CB|nr:segregation/condensation protein A [Sorangium cellulosum]
MSGSKAGAARARSGKGRGSASAAPAPAARDAAARHAAARDGAARAAAAGAPGAAEDAGPREGEYVVQLPTFEGPLDLLLHLIQQHELDILDIPVSFVTEKYLEYLKIMRSLSIDLASEYLVMAATLAHIKSKMLLPSVPAGQDDDGMPGEEEDPRAELVRRLLEYQKYKLAAAELAERGTLGRDVFTRGMSESEVPKGPAPFAPSNIFSLLDAFERVLKRTNVQIDHEVVFDRISITDRIVELTEKLSARRAMRFEDLLLDSVSKGGVIPRFEVVITFLAVLEMCKLKLIRVHQTDPLAPIHIELAVTDGAPPETAELLDGAPAAAPIEALGREEGGAPPAGDREPAAVGGGEAERPALVELAAGASGASEVAGEQPATEDVAALFVEAEEPASEDAAAPFVEAEEPASEDAAAPFVEAEEPASEETSEDAAAPFVEADESAPEDAAAAFVEAEEPASEETSEDAAAPFVEADESAPEDAAAAFVEAEEPASEETAAPFVEADESAPEESAPFVEADEPAPEDADSFVEADEPRLEDVAAPPAAVEEAPPEDAAAPPAAVEEAPPEDAAAMPSEVEEPPPEGAAAPSAGADEVDAGSGRDGG